jgi:hypothetical protein
MIFEKMSFLYLCSQALCKAVTTPCGKIIRHHDSNQSFEMSQTIYTSLAP